jgi:subtilisin family serine protease
VEGAPAAAGVDDIVRAVEWLHASGIRLVNVSLAGPYNKILDRGLRAAADRGMVIVAAAGNDGFSAPPRYPAAFDFAIAVTAVDAGLDAYERAPRGDYIDFAAPGVDVFVPVGGGGRYMSGTSIAAPFVTAVVAVGAGEGGLGSAESVRADLARRSIDLGAAGPDDTFGAGLATAPASCRSATGPS